MLSLLSKVQKIWPNSVQENATKILFAIEIQHANTNHYTDWHLTNSNTNHYTDWYLTNSNINHYTDWHIPCEIHFS